MIENIVVIGCGGLGREVMCILELINNESSRWNINGFIDDNSIGDKVNSYDVIAGVNYLATIKENINVVIAIGNPKVRKGIYSKLKTNPNITFPSIIHPRSILYTSKYVKFGKGLIVGANTVITTNVEIGDFVIINSSCVIAHDTTIGSYSILMPTTSISAGAQVGESVYIGNGTKIDIPVEIPDNEVLLAGTIINKKNI